LNCKQKGKEVLEFRGKKSADEGCTILQKYLGAVSTKIKLKHTIKTTQGLDELQINHLQYKLFTPHKQRASLDWRLITLVSANPSKQPDHHLVLGLSELQGKPAQQMQLAFFIRSAIHLAINRQREFARVALMKNIASANPPKQLVPLCTNASHTKMNYFASKLRRIAKLRFDKENQEKPETTSVLVSCMIMISIVKTLSQQRYLNQPGLKEHLIKIRNNLRRHV
jgi:hypothetical protein